MSSSDSDDFFFDEEFGWNKYLMLRKAEEVPEDFFYHVCKSELNGIESGSVIEIENEDENGYWFASICSSNGVLINLRYFGEENDKHDFWLEVKSPRIHSLNWGSENNKKLVPPFPERFSRIKPQAIKEKVQDCENVVSNAVLQMKGAPIYNIFKRGMFVEVQDKEYPYRVWVSKIHKNVGGRLFLKMQGPSCPEKKAFWLFYLNERVFPLGWADQKGLPWRVMNSDSNIESIKSSSLLLLNVLKPKTPEQHSYKVGEMLEVINPYSLMVFYVATIVKIYDNRYFKVEVNNDIDVEKRTTFVATKGSPYLFNAGWASKHKFLLKPPSDWNTSNIFCWSEYVLMKDCKLAVVDNECKKKIDRVHIGSKLEAVDPLFPSCIRVATVKGFADNWMFLSFDRTSWCQELLHVRSVYSDDVFPVGWCNKHKYLLSVPKLPYTDCNDYEHYYYTSDTDVDFNKSDENNLINYSHYLKGELSYHYSKKNSQRFEDNLEVSLQNILNDDCVESKNVSKKANDKIYATKPKVKVEPPDLDEEFHDALFLEEEVDSKKTEKDNTKIEYERNSCDTVNNGCVQKRKKEQENIIPLKRFYTNIYKMCIYFNKDCYSGCNLAKGKIANIPSRIGPGPVSRILREAITIYVNLDYFPNNALKKIKKVQHLLFNEPGGVELFVTTKAIKPHSERLLLPESKMMAQTYCSSLCNLTGMCEYFMTTENTRCIRGCNLMANDNTSNYLETVSKSSETTKKKEFSYTNSDNVDSFKNCETNKISEIGLSDESVLKCYKFYLGHIANYKTHVINLEQHNTPVESAIITEILRKKDELRWLDTLDVCSNTKSGNNEKNQFYFVDNWKTSFENYFRQIPMFKYSKIDIGHFKSIKVKSDPWCWCPKKLFKYLIHDLACKKIAKKFYAMDVDGEAFMLLNDEHLRWFKMDINLMIRLMCHVAECNYAHYTKYYNNAIAID